MAWLSFNENVNPSLRSTAEEGDLKDLKDDPPLKCTWAIWEQILPSADAKTSRYSDATHKIASFSTAQEFWRYWNHLPQPSELLRQKRMVREEEDGLVQVDALMIFRDGVRPEWEDEMNAKGGHIEYLLKPSLGGGQIDEYWNNLVLGLIGSAIDPAGMITGVRLVDKLSGPRGTNKIRLEVWFSKGDDDSSIDTLRTNLELCMSTRLDGSAGQVPKGELRSHDVNPF